MRIGVIGGGTVGHATARCFMENHEVRVFDTNPALRTHSGDQVLECDIVFICLPTPQQPDHLNCDTSILEQQFSYLGTPEHRDKNYVLRSTVPVGFTEQMVTKYKLINLVHSPEFLTARCAVTDAQLPARNIIGYPHWNFVHGSSADYVTYLREYTQPHERGFVTLCKLYQERFPGAPTYYVTSKESELVKLITNAFFAVKIAFFNEMHWFAEQSGMDWDRVLEGVLSDGRISHSHTSVPGPDGQFGFGGGCLPKDLANLIACGMSPPRNLGMPLCRAALDRNEMDRGREVAE